MNASQLATKVKKDTYKAHSYLSENIVLSLQKEQILDWLFMQDESVLLSAFKTAQEARALIYKDYTSPYHV
jgi:hypothetical protein